MRTTEKNIQKKFERIQNDQAELKMKIEKKKKKKTTNKQTNKKKIVSCNILVNVY